MGREVKICLQDDFEIEQAHDLLVGEAATRARMIRVLRGVQCYWGGMERR